jgi:glutathione peroxidase
MGIFFFTNSNAQDPISNLKNYSIYNPEEINIVLNDINGNPIDLRKFKGKYILFVNVASECGFTKQYAGLEELHQKYRSDLIVIALPCNQFGNQEKGTEKEIQQFCANNFKISFLMTEKVKVKGNEQHPLYGFLCSKSRNGQLDSTVRWNFQKYLVDKEGVLVDYFYSTTKPMSTKITALIQ